MALTSVVMKSFEKLVLAHLKDITALHSLSKAFNRSTFILLYENRIRIHLGTIYTIIA